MSIKDDRYYKTTYHDFDIFEGCFGDSSIMPTDVDFLVERRRNFLFIEFKPEGVLIRSGQRILLENLSKVPKFTVVAVFHEPRKPHEKLEVTNMRIFPGREIIPMDNDGIIDYVKEWYRLANRLQSEIEEELKK